MKTKVSKVLGNVAVSVMFCFVHLCNCVVFPPSGCIAQMIYFPSLREMLDMRKLERNCDNNCSLIIPSFINFKTELTKDMPRIQLDSSIEPFPVKRTVRDNKL